MASSSSVMFLARSVMANRSTKKCPLNPSRAIPDEAGWRGRARTSDLAGNSRLLYQLSYTPKLVPTRGIEPRVIRLQGGCIASNAWRAYLVGSRESNPATEV